ncbi:MAG: hypothetical protein GX640_14745 [Fibrobacter sp.]|nr:hypothetical protein [Fibrobacter sp.]
MRKHWKATFSLCLLVSASAIFAVDPNWMYKDDIPYAFRYCDTARGTNFECIVDLPDTGGLDGSRYINFDYQFVDTFKVFDKYDPDVPLYQDYRPGFAGFKTAWEMGMIGFPVARYKYLIFSHKGLLPNHKVTIKAWYNNGECGSESYCETLGQFFASDVWKEDTIVIPPTTTNKDDIARNTSVYYELVFVITNIDTTDLSPSAPGNLKVDKIRLVGYNPVTKSPESQTVARTQPVTFTVTAQPSTPGEPLAYQWMKDGQPITGATATTYTIASVAHRDSGNYYVAVTDIKGFVYNSQPAKLIVTGEPDPDESSSGCGCGAGTGLAFIPPFLYRALTRKRNKNKK